MPSHDAENPPTYARAERTPTPAPNYLVHLAPEQRATVAAQTALAEEVRCSQALQAENAMLRSLCAHLGVAPSLPVVFLDLEEVRANDALAAFEKTQGAQSMRKAFLATYPEVRAYFEHTTRPQVRMCAAAMVLRREAHDEAEVLLVRRAPSAPYGAGCWTLPAGGTSPSDRSLIDTAARELSEETGLVLQDPRVVRLVDGLTPTTGGFPYACAIVLGAAQYPHATNREPDIHDDLRWFKSQDIPANTWDRAMLQEIMACEEEAHWSTEAACPSITQAPPTLDEGVAAVMLACTYLQRFADRTGVRHLPVRYLPLSEMKIEGVGGFTDPASSMWIECNASCSVALSALPGSRPGIRETIIDDGGAKRREFFRAVEDNEQTRDLRELMGQVTA